MPGSNSHLLPPAIIRQTLQAPLAKQKLAASEEMQAGVTRSTTRASASKQAYFATPRLVAAAAAAAAAAVAAAEAPAVDEVERGRPSSGASSCGSPDQVQLQIQQDLQQQQKLCLDLLDRLQGSFSSVTEIRGVRDALIPRLHRWRELVSDISHHILFFNNLWICE